MLLTVVPVAFVFLACRPGVGTISMFLVILKATNIHSSILIMQRPLTPHKVLFPFAIILSIITPFILTSAFELIVFPIALILGLISPFVDTVA